MSTGADAKLVIFHDSNVAYLSSTYTTSAGFKPIVFRTSDTDVLKINTDGSAVLGTDPGGSALLRVGGGARVEAASFFNGEISYGDSVNVAVSTVNGTKIGTTTSEKLGMWGKTPVVQPASANQAAVATTAATNVAPYGYTTSAQADGVITLLNEIRAALVSIGVIKGSA